MKPSNKLTFEEVINLTHQNLSAGLAAAKLLSKEDYKHFHHYISNLVLHSEAAQYRGKVIEMSIYLETILAKILSCYFGAEDKVLALNSIVFDRMDLQTKLNKLKTILKVFHADIWKRESKLIKKIDKYISFRNNLAHSILNSTIEYNNRFSERINDFITSENSANKIDQIEFGFFDNHEFKYKSITREDIEEYHENMIQILKDIERIAKEIAPNY